MCVSAGRTFQEVGTARAKSQKTEEARSPVWLEPSGGRDERGDKARVDREGGKEQWRMGMEDKGRMGRRAYKVGLGKDWPYCE